MKNLVIFSCGGFAREVHQILEDINSILPTWNFLGFLDDNITNHGKKIHGSQVLGGIDWLSQTSEKNVYVIVAVGNPAIKHQIVKNIKELKKINFATVVHPRAWVGNRVVIGQGSVICAGALITTDILIGEHVIVNIGSTIGHDTVLKDFVTIAPTVNVSGSVHVGDGVDLGTGSTVIQGRTIGSWSIVGAGAVVVKDVGANVTVVGAPAKIIKERPAGWHLE